MFVPLWMIFLLSGTALAVATIVWAVRAQQFEDQDRARYLPLAGLRAADYAAAARPARRGQGYYITLGLVTMGAGVIVATLWLVTASL